MRGVSRDVRPVLGDRVCDELDSALNCRRVSCREVHAEGGKAVFLVDEEVPTRDECDTALNRATVPPLGFEPRRTSHPDEHSTFRPSPLEGLGKVTFQCIEHGLLARTVDLEDAGDLALKVAAVDVLSC